MNEFEAITARHSVRSYVDRHIRTDAQNALRSAIDTANKSGNLNIQLILDEPKAFGTFMAHYGKFTNVRNYIALVGTKENGLDERCGYWGEKLVLLAQTLGLNTCWVAGTFSRRQCAAIVDKGQRLVCVIAIGYGTNQGVTRATRSPERLCVLPKGIDWNNAPTWFKTGVEAAALAPTAMNQQNFRIELLENSCVLLTPTGGPFAALDAGIARYNFEVGAIHAGHSNLLWSSDQTPMQIK